MANERDENLLLRAVFRSDTDTARPLLDAGADPNAADEDGETPSCACGPDLPA